MRNWTSADERHKQVLGNKNDLKTHAKVDEIIESLGLRSITNREVSVYSISGAFSFSLPGQSGIDRLLSHRNSQIEPQH
jgi:hypothetical protein